MVRLTALACLFAAFIGCEPGSTQPIDDADLSWFCDDLRLATECDGTQDELPECESILQSVPDECPIWIEDLYICADLSNTCLFDDRDEAANFCSTLFAPGCGELPRLVIAVGGDAVFQQAPLPVLPPGMVTGLCEELSFENTSADSCPEPSLFPDGLTSGFCEDFVATMGPACPATVGDLQSCMTFMSANPCAGVDDYDPCARLSHRDCSNNY